MSKSKAFKRKLKKPYHGFRYYRIWGWPLDVDNVLYHKDKYGKDPLVAVFYHKEFGWLRLAVDRVRMSPAAARYRHQSADHALNGTISNHYFSKEAQALRILREYADGIRHDGLTEMVDYHQRVDAFAGY